MALAKTILIVGGVALAVMVAGAYSDSTPPPELQKAAGVIRARGYPCQQILDARRVGVVGVAGHPEAPRKIYRLRCGPAGPDYRLVVEPDGLQTLAPWPSPS